MIHIGVSACFMYPDLNRIVYGPKTLSYIENDMARYLTRPGVMPVLIPDLAEQPLQELLTEMDGFVFQGGTDIAPESYGEKQINAGRWPGDAMRDQYELKLLDFAIRKRRPILGICRGCQLINIYYRGTLYQDISTQKEAALEHRDASEYDKVHHEIRFAKDGILVNIYPNLNAPHVNSVHHQGIKDLGQGLRVEATSAHDGLIEAIATINLAEHFVLGVQWHPEFSHTLGAQTISPEPLYDYFIEQVNAL